MQLSLLDVKAIVSETNDVVRPDRHGSLSLSANPLGFQRDSTAIEPNHSSNSCLNRAPPTV